MEDEDSLYKNAFGLFVQDRRKEISTREVGEALLALGSPFADEVDFCSEVWNIRVSLDEFHNREAMNHERAVTLEACTALLDANVKKTYNEAQTQREGVSTIVGGASGKYNGGDADLEQETSLSGPGKIWMPIWIARRQPASAWCIVTLWLGMVSLGGCLMWGHSIYECPIFLPGVPYYYYKSSIHDADQNEISICEGEGCYNATYYYDPYEPNPWNEVFKGTTKKGWETGPDNVPDFAFWLMLAIEWFLAAIFTMSVPIAFLSDTSQWTQTLGKLPPDPKISTVLYFCIAAVLKTVGFLGLWISCSAVEPFLVIGFAVSCVLVWFLFVRAACLLYEEAKAILPTDPDDLEYVAME